MKNHESPLGVLEEFGPQTAPPHVFNTMPIKSQKMVQRVPQRAYDPTLGKSTADEKRVRDAWFADKSSAFARLVPARVDFTRPLRGRR